MTPDEKALAAIREFHDLNYELSDAEIIYHFALLWAIISIEQANISKQLEELREAIR
jgi:hypothetical protein